MNTTIQKWGNSQGLRLAQGILSDAGVKVGDSVTVSVHAKEIIIRRYRAKKFDLKELVKLIPSNTKPVESDWGKPMGKEVW